MSDAVVMTAMMECCMGLAPCPLTPIPKGMTITGLPVANIMDFAPIVNIATFGMCTSLANPEVAAATAAALGVLTPMPCIPVTTPWKPGSTVATLLGFPVLTNTSTCQCAFGGVITITEASQVIVEVA